MTQSTTRTSSKRRRAVIATLGLAAAIACQRPLVSTGRCQSRWECLCSPAWPTPVVPLPASS
jgi:hypothetical protein